MKSLITTFLLLFSLLSYAQETQTLQLVTPIKDTIIYVDHFKSLKSYSIDSVRILNHAGEYRATLKNIKGISLKELLKDFTLGAESPKVLSQYYITCVAADGYSVVLSWNELFNNPSGDNIIIVTDIGGSTISLALLSPHDYATGRRYVKQLKTIKISRITK